MVHYGTFCYEILHQKIHRKCVFLSFSIAVENLLRNEAIEYEVFILIAVTIGLQ